METDSLDELSMLGALYTLPDPDMTEAMIDELLVRAQNTDFLLIADSRYGGRRRKQKRSLPMQGNLGEKIELHLPATTVTGAW